MTTEGDEEMYVMSIMRHSPESCAISNEATKKSTLLAMGQMDKLAAKHGVKPVGFWNDTGGHTVYSIFDTPSLDACWALFNEPEILALLAYNTAEWKVVLSAEQAMALL